MQFKGQYCTSRLILFCKSHPGRENIYSANCIECSDQDADPFTFRLLAVRLSSIIQLAELQSVYVLGACSTYR